MLRKVLFLTFILWFLPACQVRADVIYSIWIGEDGEWASAGNWEPSIVPDNNGSQSFAVTIDGGSGEKKQVGIQQSRTINQLDCYGNVWLESRTPYNIVFALEDSNGLTNYGNLRIRGGAYNERTQFKIRAALRNESGSTLELFGVQIESGFYNSSGAAAVLKYENCFPGGVENDGAISIDPLGEMSADANIINAGQIQIFGGTCAATGQLLNDVNGVIEGFGVIHSDESTENAGKIHAASGSLIVHNDSSLTNTGILGNKPLAALYIKPANDVSNFGTIESNLRGGIVFDCNLVNEPNGIIELHGGALAARTIVQSAGARFVGFGGITGDTIIESDGLVQLIGPTNIIGDVEIGPNATLEISDGTTLITGRTTNDGTIHMKGGRIIPQGGLTNNGSIIWEPGTYSNMADFNLDGQVNFRDFANFADTWLWQADWSTP